MTLQIPESTAAAIKEAVRRGLSGLAMPPPQTLSKWAPENFYIAPSRKGKSEGRFRPYPYQNGLLDLLSNDDVRVLSIMKASRLGVSVLLEAGVAYALQHKKRSVALFCDTEDERDQTVKDQYHPMFDLVPSLRETRLGAATLAKTAFVGGSFHARGGNSKRAYQRISVDWAIYEELDRFPDNVGGTNRGVTKKRGSSADRGEGSPTDLGDTRLTQSAFRKSIRNSSPSIKGLSKIEQSLETADVVLSYHVPCANCGDIQLLEWGGPDVEYGIKFDVKNGKPDNVRYRCRSCSDDMTYGQMLDVLAGGRWQDEHSSVFLGEGAQFLDHKGNPIPTPDHVGIWQDSLISPDISWTDDVAQFLRATEHKKKGDVGPLKTYTNTRRARTWEDMPESKADAHAFQSRAEEYGDLLPVGIKAIFAGCDVHPDRLELTIRGLGVGEESWLIDHKRFTGSPQSSATWDWLQEQFDALYKTEDGRHLNVLVLGLDQGFSPTEVNMFARKPGNVTRVIPVYGSSHLGQGKAIITPPERPTGRHKTYQSEVGTDNAKSRLFHRIGIERDGTGPQPGYMHFPIGRGFTLDYYKQLLESEVIVVRWSRGRMVYTYEKRSDSTRNEALDCLVYTEAAYEFWRIRQGGNLDTYKPQARDSDTQQTNLSRGERARRIRES